MLLTWSIDFCRKFFRKKGCRFQNQSNLIHVNGFNNRQVWKPQRTVDNLSLFNKLSTFSPIYTATENNLQRLYLAYSATRSFQQPTSFYGRQMSYDPPKYLVMRTMPTREGANSEPYLDMINLKTSPRLVRLYTSTYPTGWEAEQPITAELLLTRGSRPTEKHECWSEQMGSKATRQQWARTTALNQNNCTEPADLTARTLDHIRASWSILWD